MILFFRYILCVFFNLGCVVNYIKFGCFRDDRKKFCLLFQLLFIDCDFCSKVFSGKIIDWNNWDNYIVDLVC